MDMEENNPIFDARYLAVYISNRYKEKYEKEISPIKLQKSLYFLFAIWGGYVYKSIVNEAEEKIDYSYILFSNKIEAWVYGPVVPAVYCMSKSEYNQYENPNLFDGKEEVKDVVDTLLNQIFVIGDFKLVSISHEDKSWLDKFDISS